MTSPSRFVQLITIQMTLTRMSAPVTAEDDISHEYYANSEDEEGAKQSSLL